jgi:hypothetical protein
MLAPQASKIRSPGRPSSATKAKSLMLVDGRGGGDQGLELQVPEPERG